MAPQTLTVEVMKPGTHMDMRGTEVTFSSSDLAGMAGSYSRALFEAPAVIGHPTVDAPAYGWVQELAVRDGVLKATIGDLEPQFAQMVEDRRYAKVSGSFYGPNARANPTPGRWYLRHVGFLGAAAPAIPGLKSVSFAGDETDTHCFADDPRDAEIARLRGALMDVRRTANLAMLQSLVKEGRVQAGTVDGLASFMETLSDKDTFSFAEASGERTESPLTFMKRFLSNLPTMVDFGQLPPDSQDRDDMADAPPGWTPDPVGQQLLRRAQAIQKAQGISFTEAVKIAERQG